MENHVLCYVQRCRITDWKRLVLTHQEPSFVYGSNDDRVFRRNLKRGGTLWVVASIPGRPPELVARLSVITVAGHGDPELEALGISARFLKHFSEFRWIAVGGQGSEFFGHNIAGKALLETTFESSTGNPWMLSAGSKVWRGEHGKKLQRPVKVSASSLNSLEHGATALKSLAATGRNSVFISWKWRDNSKRRIISLAYALAENGFMPWVDLLALPMSKALLQVQQNEEKLRILLRYGYRRCIGVIGIETLNYGKQSEGSADNWTLREWEGGFAEEGTTLVRIVYRPDSTRDCCLMPRPDLRLSGADPGKAAGELCRWLKHRHQS
jgi:hypothetical protein